MLEVVTVFNVTRIFIVAALAFFINLFVTYFWTKVLYKYFATGKKVEREKGTFWGETPVFNQLHKKKQQLYLPVCACHIKVFLQQ